MREQVAFYSLFSSPLRPHFHIRAYAVSFCIYVSHKALLLYLYRSHMWNMRLISKYILCFVTIVSCTLPAEAASQDSFGNGHPSHIEICVNHHKAQAHARVRTRPCMTQAFSHSQGPSPSLPTWVGAQMLFLSYGFILWEEQVCSPL